MAKKVRMMIQETCPYCVKAKGYMKELVSEHPEYGNVEIEVIDELRHPDIADTLDYWYVPTYFVDGVKVHEGAASKADVEGVYQMALA